MFDSIVIAESPDMTEKLHGLSSTINRLNSSTTGRYDGIIFAPERIMSNGFSLIRADENFGIPSRMQSSNI